MVEKSKAVQRAAHHEAGHVVVAAKMRAPIGRSGMCVDDVDRGHSDIKLRRPHVPGRYPVSREDSIVVLYAGLFAEEYFDSTTTGASACCDLAIILGLADMDPPIRTAELKSASHVIVKENKNAINRLAEELLRKEFEVSPVKLPWTESRNVACLCGRRIREILADFGIPVKLIGEEIAD